MRELSASEILDVWERGRGRTLPERALDLLVAGGHGEPPPDLLSVGERDAVLVELRELTFGPSLPAVVACPSCSEQLEIELAADDLREEGGSPDEIELGLEGHRVRFRPPTAGDLVEVARVADVEEGRAVLLRRCVLEGEISPEVEAAVAARMAEADPGAWIELALACPECGN